MKIYTLILCMLISTCVFASELTGGLATEKLFILSAKNYSCTISNQHGVDSRANKIRLDRISKKSYAATVYYLYQGVFGGKTEETVYLKDQFIFVNVDKDLNDVYVNESKTIKLFVRRQAQFQGALEAFLISTAIGKRDGQSIFVETRGCSH